MPVCTRSQSRRWKDTEGARREEVVATRILETIVATATVRSVVSGGDGISSTIVSHRVAGSDDNEERRTATYDRRHCRCRYDSIVAPSSHSRRRDGDVVDNCVCYNCDTFDNDNVKTVVIDRSDESRSAKRRETSASLATTTIGSAPPTETRYALKFVSPIKINLFRVPRNNDKITRMTGNNLIDKRGKNKRAPIASLDRHAVVSNIISCGNEIAKRRNRKRSWLATRTKRDEDAYVIGDFTAPRKIVCRTIDGTTLLEAARRVVNVDNGIDNETSANQYCRAYDSESVNRVGLDALLNDPRNDRVTKRIKFIRSCEKVKADKYSSSDITATSALNNSRRNCNLFNIISDNSSDRSRDEEDISDGAPERAAVDASNVTVASENFKSVDVRRVTVTTAAAAAPATTTLANATTTTVTTATAKTATDYYYDGDSDTDTDTDDDEASDKRRGRQSRSIRDEPRYVSSFACSFTTAATAASSSSSSLASTSSLAFVAEASGSSSDSSSSSSGDSSGDRGGGVVVSSSSSSLESNENNLPPLPDINEAYHIENALFQALEINDNELYNDEYPNSLDYDSGYEEH